MTKFFYFLGHEQFQPEILVDHAKLAEKVGFDGLFVSEHFNPWVADNSASGFALSTLGAIAASTHRIELMTGVITPLFRYHPAVVAQAAATLDRLSKGRFTLGVGTGESINETALGYEFPDYKTRSKRMQEALQIMEKLLKGETLTFKGEFYSTVNAHLYSPPTHNMPIFMASGGPKSSTLAAEFADGIIVSIKNPEDSLNQIITPAKQKAEELKKEKFSVVSSRWTIYAQNEGESFKAVRAWKGLRAPSREGATDPRELQKEADQLSHEEVLSKYSIVKTPEDYINVYAPLIETINSDIVVIQTTSIDQPHVIKILGKHVLPELRKLK